MKKIRTLWRRHIHTCGNKDIAICLCMIWNKGALTQHKTCWKSCHSLGLQAPNYMNQIFQLRYCTFFKSRGCKNIWGQSWRTQRKVPTRPTQTQCTWGQLIWQIFYRPPDLTFDIFGAYWPTRMQSTSFERSDSYRFVAWSPRLWYYFYKVLCWIELPLFDIIQRQMAISFLPRV